MAYEEHIASAGERAARCAVITLSDTRTPATDTSGQLIRELLESRSHIVAQYVILKDDPAALDARMHELLATPTLDAVLTTGGTGISRRDQTIAVIEKHLDQPLPGFGELFRMLSWEKIGSGAMLSRAIGGIARGKVIFAMPGSTKAVELAMTRLILPELNHLLGELHK